MNLDSKEKLMLTHYKQILERHNFDEYDIMGFLIFVREHIREQGIFPGILEFADMIAHRGRDRGVVMKCIKVAIDNEYHTYDGKRVKDYHGISEGQWKDEWCKLFNILDIRFDKRLLDEVTLCVCTLACGTKYDDGEGHSGYLNLVLGRDSLSLATTEGHRDSLLVNFLVYHIDVGEPDTKYYICDMPLETERVNGTLKIKDGNNYVI